MPAVCRALLAASLLLFPGLARAEDAWLVRAVEAVRWPDAPQVSVTLAEGDQVAVVYRMDGLVRVRKEDRYGWVPADALAAEAPAAAAPPEAPADLELPPMPALQIPGLGTRPATKPTGTTP